MNLLLNFILTTGLLATLVIIGILFKQRKELPKRLLILIFGLLFFVVLYSYSELNNIKSLFATTFVFADTIGFLLGPLLFIYIKSIFQKKEAISLNFLWHFLPAFCYLILVSIPFLISELQDEYLFSYLQFIDKNEYLLQIQALYLCAYVLLSLTTLQKFRNLTKENYSNLAKKEVWWIQYLLYGVLFIILINISIEVYSFATNDRLPFDNTLTTIVLVLLILYLGFFGILQSPVLVPEYLLERFYNKKEYGGIDQQQPTHHLAGANDEEIALLKEQLMQLLETKKPYLDEHLSLKTLAEMIPTTDRKLSALLNHYYGINFYDFVNAYRVREVQKKMTQRENDKYTVLALAFDAGFNSKSSFNRIFKKETGLSPSAYKKHLQPKP